MSHCLNCGCRVFRGLCVNCHEENYIEQQYNDLNLPTPKSIYEKARENERDVYLNPIDDKKKDRSIK